MSGARCGIVAYALGFAREMTREQLNRLGASPRLDRPCANIVVAHFLCEVRAEDAQLTELPESRHWRVTLGKRVVLAVT